MNFFIPQISYTTQRNFLNFNKVIKPRTFCKFVKTMRTTNGF